MSAATITVHEAIVEAVASLDRPNRDHSQLCPCSSDSRARMWAKQHGRPATIWNCNCWRLPRLRAIADRICDVLDGAA